MQDKFEQFIDAHRDEFDVHEPGHHVWQALDKKLNKRKGGLKLRYASLAAAILIIAGAGIWFFYGTHTHSRVAETHGTYAPEITQAEYNYAVQVKGAIAELNKYQRDYPELCEDFNKEVASLNKAYDQLKGEYNETNGNESVIKAMIENLKMQMKILNLQLQILEDIKQKESVKGKNNVNHKNFM